MDGYEDLVPKKSSGGGDYSDLVPKEPKAKPRLPSMFTTAPQPEAEAAGSMATLRGLTSEVLGIPGAITGLMNPKRTEAESVQDATPENIRKLYTKLGSPEPTTEPLKAAQFAGEITPAIAAGGSLLKKGLGISADYLGNTSIGKALEKGYSSLTGKAAKEASAQAKKAIGEIQQAGTAGKQQIGQRAEESAQTEFQKRARQEANLKQAQKKFMTAAEKERQDAAMKFADLKAPDPKIKDNATLGDAMQRRLTGSEATVGSRRTQQASRVYGEYFEEAKGFETSKARESMLQKLKALSESSSAGSAEREAASKAFADLSASQDAVGAEKEFRKYFEGASGPPQPGYGAIQQEASKKVSDIIGDALNTHAPKRIQARKEYSEFSTPLDAFETFFGKKGVKEEANVPGRIQMQPTDYPATYFKNRDTIRSLREQLRGDEAAVRKFANAHAVNELNGLDAKQAVNWFEKNKPWVDEVPGLKDRISKYVQDLTRSEQAAATKVGQAGKLAEKSQKVIETGQATEQKIRDLAESQKKQIDDMLIKLNTLDPQKSAGAAKSMIDTLSTMRDINGKTIIEPGALKNLEMQIKMVNDAYGASEKATQLRKAIIYKALATTGLGGAAYFGSRVFGD